MIPCLTTVSSGGNYSFYTVEEPEIQRVQDAGIQATSRKFGLKFSLSQSKAHVIIMICTLKGNLQYAKKKNTYKLCSAWVQFETQSYNVTSGIELCKRDIMQASYAI